MNDNIIEELLYNLNSLPKYGYINVEIHPQGDRYWYLQLPKKWQNVKLKIASTLQLIFDDIDILPIYNHHGFHITLDENIIITKKLKVKDKLFFIIGDYIQFIPHRYNKIYQKNHHTSYYHNFGWFVLPVFLHLNSDETVNGHISLAYKYV